MGHTKKSIQDNRHFSIQKNTTIIVKITVIKGDKYFNTLPITTKIIKLTLKS